jgi:two-component system, NarL family, response regulator DegU
MNTNPNLDILLADPFPMFRAGVRQYLGTWYPQAVIRESGDKGSLMEMLVNQPPDLLISELQIPPGDAFEVMKSLPQPATKGVLIISQYKDSRLVRDIFKLGVLGFLHKSSGPEELQKAVRAVLRKEVFLGTGVSLTEQPTSRKAPETQSFRDFFQLRYELTPRELEVLANIKQGLNNREIAEALFISEQTVSVHRKNILRKVGVNNTQKLLRITYEHHVT